MLRVDLRELAQAGAALTRGELKQDATPVNLEIGALFTQDPEALDDPDSYAVAPDATEIDVTPAVREELMLAAPRYVLCRDDCKGLCPRCGKDLNAGSCECAPATEARWQPLKALKDKLSS